MDKWDRFSLIRVNRRRYTRAVCFAAVLMLAPMLSGKAQSQSDYLLQKGSPTFTTADTLPSGIGFINVANGNAHIEIPIAHYLQRGGRPNFTARLIYDSRQWYEFRNAVPPSWSFSATTGGWSIITSEDTGTYNNFEVTDCANGDSSTLQYKTFTWFAPDNTSHYFPITLRVNHGCGAETNITSGDAFALDASGLHMFAKVTPGVRYQDDQISVTVYTTDGTSIVPYWSASDGLVKDSNGNFSQGHLWQGGLTASSPPTFLGIPPSDTLNRQPLTVTYPANPQYYTPPTSFGVLNSKNLYDTLTPSWALIHVHTNFAVTSYTEGDFFIYVLRSLTLPDGTSYQFTYDCDSSTGIAACGSPAGQTGYYGLLTSITVPTGGATQLAYRNFQDANSNVNRWVSSRTSGGTWAYDQSTACGVSCQTVTVSKPSGDQEVYKFDLSTGSGAWNNLVSYYTGAAAGNPLMTLQSQYQSYPLDPYLFVGKFSYTHPTSTTVTLSGPSGNLVRQTLFNYDSFSYTSGGAAFTGTHGKLLDKTETGFGGGAVRKTVYQYWDDTHAAYKNVNLINLVSDIQIQDVSGPTPTTKSETKTTYDSTPVMCPIINGACANQIANHDDANFGTSNTVRGNPTVIQTVVSGTPMLATTLNYDTTGHIVSQVGPAGNQTTFGYGDSFFTENGTTTPQNYSPPVATNAYLTSVTLPLIGKSTFGYYYGSAKPAVDTDQNNATTRYHFNDTLHRLTSITMPNNGWLIKVYTPQVAIDTYTGITDPQPAQPSPNCTGCRRDYMSLDGFGRLSATGISDPDGPDSVSVGYDSNDRQYYKTTPFRTSNDPTFSRQYITFDGLDRPTVQKKVSIFSYQPTAQKFYGALVSGVGGASSQLCAIATYGSGYPTLTIDETGRKRQEWTDALGRLIEVDEPDSSGALTVGTCYSFDVLDNLTAVVEGTRTRAFIYDSASRPTSATNSESGTTLFYYTTASRTLCADNLQAVCRVKDARGITTTYTYDTLSRLKTKSYSDGVTAAVTFYYDNNLATTNGLGRMIGVGDATGNLIQVSYDAAGRIVTETTKAAGVTKTTSYARNLDGSISSITYPSGRKVLYAYSTAQRLLSAIDATSATSYVAQAHYSPVGDLTSAIYGQVSGTGGITESRTYDNFLSQRSVSDTSSAAGNFFNLSFSFYHASAPVGNNGDVTSIFNNTASDNKSFNYDNLNRVASVSGATSGAYCFGETFGIDSVGNLNAITPTSCAPGMLGVVTNNNNQITGTGFAYDLVGNMTQDGSGVVYTFDAENRITKASGTAGLYAYSYDPAGFRMKKSSSVGGTLYWRNLAGDTLAETDLTGVVTNEYVFFGQRRIARINSGSTYYYLEDYLDSPRVIAQSNAVPCYNGEFTPYGQEMQHIPNTCPQNYKFTGYERDVETGLDYAVGRFYNSRLGRFMSADPLGASPDNPQSWNGYAYVENNPVNYTDPSGLDPDFYGWLSYDAGANSISGGYVASGSGPVGAFGGGFGGSAAAVPAQLFWTPNGYNPCALGGCGVFYPAAPAPFSPPGFSFEGTGTFLGQEVLGVWDVTGGGLISTLRHPISSAKGLISLANTISNPYGNMDEVAAIGDAGIAWWGKFSSGDPRAIGQGVGVVASLAYFSENVELQNYPRGGGGGLNIYNTPTRGSRLAADWGGKWKGGSGFHFDTMIKRLPEGWKFWQEASGPGSNWFLKRHWQPW